MLTLIIVCSLQHKMAALWVNIILLVPLVNAQTWYSYERHEYYIEKEKFVYSYADAERACAAKSATVANVKTSELQNFLVEKVGNLSAHPHSLFIGATRIAGTINFNWTDGTRVGVEQWKDREPNNSGGNENCVTMGYSGAFWKGLKWIDVSCISRGRYICQRNLPATTSSTTTSASTTTSQIKQTTAFHTTKTLEMTTNNKLQETTDASVTKSDHRGLYNTTAQNTSDQRSDSLQVVVIASVIGCVIIITGVAMFLILRKRQRSKKQTKSENQEYAEIGSNTNQAPTNGNAVNLEPENAMVGTGNVPKTNNDQSEHAYGSVFNEIYNIDANDTATYATAEDSGIRQKNRKVETKHQHKQHVKNPDCHEMYYVGVKIKTGIKQQYETIQPEPVYGETTSDVYAVVDKKKK